jgi:hypothetical protein
MLGTTTPAIHRLRLTAPCDAASGYVTAARMGARNGARRLWSCQRHVNERSRTERYRASWRPLVGARIACKSSTSPSRYAVSRGSMPGEEPAVLAGAAGGPGKWRPNACQRPPMSAAFQRAKFPEEPKTSLQLRLPGLSRAPGGVGALASSWSPPNGSLSRSREAVLKSKAVGSGRRPLGGVGPWVTCTAATALISI